MAVWYSVSQSTLRGDALSIQSHCRTGRRVGDPALRSRFVFFHVTDSRTCRELIRATEGTTPIGVERRPGERPLQAKYPDLPADYYIPKDSWFIRARLLKQGVTAPGRSASVQSSKSDLDELRRRFNVSSLSQSAEEKNPLTMENVTGSGPSSATPSHVPGRIFHGVWVFVDIQLYQLEENNYMVDFKCDGYQNVIRAEGETDWHPISKRYFNKEKEITSPYPFLDVASDLVAQLAVAS